MSSPDTSIDADVVIVGAGFCGAVSAYNLTQQGIKTILVEQTAIYPDAFRAEKIEPNQADALRRLSLLDCRLPSKPALGDTLNYRDGELTNFDTIEQYGMNYADTVNNIRKNLQDDVEFINSKVLEINLSEDIQTVITAEREIKSRLIIIATGGRENLINKVGISRRYQPTLKSLSFAFNIEPNDSEQFKFNGFNYFLTGASDGMDYVTIFKIGDIMRVNVFTQWDTKSPQTKKFKTNPKVEMSHYFPDLIDQIGDYNVVSKVQAFPTVFYRLKDTSKPGVVIVGDDFQSVCPATGTGLDKVTTDVERLCHHYVPNWLKSSGMSASKISQYYDDSEKRLCDNSSLEKWIAYRDNHRGFFGRQASRVELKWRKILGHW